MIGSKYLIILLCFGLLRMLSGRMQVFNIITMMVIFSQCLKLFRVMKYLIVQRALYQRPFRCVYMGPISTLLKWLNGFSASCRNISYFY